MTEMVTSGSMSGDARRSDGLLGESGHERRRSQQAPPVLYVTALVLDSTCAVKGQSTQPVKVRSKEVSVHLGSYPGDGEGDRPVEASGTEIRLGRVSERTGRNASEA
jgi:hypothetical protein